MGKAGDSSYLKEHLPRLSKAEGAKGAALLYKLVY